LLLRVTLSGTNSPCPRSYRPWEPFFLLCSNLRFRSVGHHSSFASRGSYPRLFVQGGLQITQDSGGVLSPEFENHSFIPLLYFNVIFPNGFPAPPPSVFSDCQVCQVSLGRTFPPPPRYIEAAPPPALFSVSTCRREGSFTRLFPPPGFAFGFLCQKGLSSFPRGLRTVSFLNTGPSFFP